MSEYIGIDFGTTRSTVVIYKDTQDTRGTRDGITQLGNPVLSIAAVDKTNGKCYYGIDAKSKISEEYDYVPSLKDLLCEKMEYDRNYGGVTVTRNSILKGYFEYIKTIIGQSGELEIVMAVPNDFPMVRRRVLRSAAEAAGFRIKTFITEPIAAFFASYSHLTGYNESAILRNYENVAIFDWGGGTLDVTVMQRSGRIVKELAKKRMDCAGNAIDERVAQCVHQWISEKMGKNKSFEDVALRAQVVMKQFVEVAKIELNNERNVESTEITIGAYDSYGAVSQEITRKKFNECIEYIIDAAIETLRKTINESKLGIGGIDKILLVGGSSKLLLLQKKMKAEFGDKLLISSGDSDWGVSIGAALLSSAPGDFIVNQDVSLRLSDGDVYPLIKKEERISKYQKNPQPFYFGKVDDSAKAVFTFTGSEDIDKSPEKYLGIQTASIWDELIQLEVSIDENMIVNVVASCQGLPDGARCWSYANLSCCYELPND